MKNLFFPLMLLLAGMLFFAACTTEDSSSTVLDTNEVLSALEVKDLLQDDYTAYMSSHETVSIEYSSLEDLNQLLIAEGLEPVTLEEVGVTEEEYAQAQKAINDPDALTSRCSGYWAVLLGDMNGNGNLSTLDVVLARRCFLGLGCSNPGQYSFFGWMSVIWGVDTSGNYSVADENTAIQVILGILPCQ